MALDVQIGPMRVSVHAEGDVALRFGERLRGFARGSHEAPDWTLMVSERRPPDVGRRVVGRSREVDLRMSLSPDPRVYARMRVTPRSVARSIKRIGDRVHYREGRWSLLLRNAFELPALSLLEYRYGFVPIHAATLAGPTGAVMLLGGNGAGKSTLACELSDRLHLDLLSDNFSPCNGTTVLPFPGAPRAKPGRVLPHLMPRNHVARLRGLVTVGFSLPTDTGERRTALARYLGEDYDAHRGTDWATAIAGEDAELRSRALNTAVADELGQLPYTCYDWSNDGLTEVLNFAKRIVSE